MGDDIYTEEVGTAIESWLNKGRENLFTHESEDSEFGRYRVDISDFPFGDDADEAAKILDEYISSKSEKIIEIIGIEYDCDPQTYVYEEDGNVYLELEYDCELEEG